MKLHKPLVQGVVAILRKIVVEQQHADKVIEFVFKQNSRWGARDRKFLASNTYDIIRNYRLIEETAININPAYKNNFFFYFAVWQVINNYLLPEWEEFDSVNSIHINAVVTALKKNRKFRESFPDWMDDLMVDELGEEVWERESSALNEEADVVIRVNTIKCDAEKLMQEMSNSGIELEPINWMGLRDSFRLKTRKNIKNLPAFLDGFFEIQDASSQLIAPFLNPVADSIVIDACAGAGGKSLHIAAVMNNRGKIISMDVEQRKLDELAKRAQRAGIKIIETKLINDSTITLYKNKADYLLLDVPCSGSGTIRRKPDLKWKLHADFIKEIKVTQAKILSDYSSMLKIGGCMVYATCSILPSENEKQIEQFLSANNSFEFLRDVKIFPSQGFDGFYMALLKRKY